MKKYRVIVSPDAKEDLRRALAYIKKELKNPQAARNVMDDYIATRKTLSNTAASLKEPEPDSICGKRGLKRINFLRHNYFILFKLDGDDAIVTNIFHGTEDYEEKLK